MILKTTKTQKNNNTLFMNLSKKIAATALMFIAFVSVANAQIASTSSMYDHQSDRSTATSIATATIIQPIMLEATEVLAFGNIIPHAGGTVEISIDGTPTPIGVKMTETQKGTHTAAAYIVTGEKNLTYAITLPEDEHVVLNLEDGSGTSAEKMAVTDFKHSITEQIKLSDIGTSSFKVGATLHVVSNQVAGRYSGEYTVIVNYN
jgi:hypothetical protein